jgi:hypothetical protein
MEEKLFLLLLHFGALIESQHDKKYCLWLDEVNKVAREETFYELKLIRLMD